MRIEDADRYRARCLALEREVYQLRLALLDAQQRDFARELSSRYGLRGPMRLDDSAGSLIPLAADAPEAVDEGG